MIDQAKNAAGVQAASRLRSALPALSESERRVALWILDHVDLAIRQSMSAIAQTVEVSDTTVLRMCRTAGFAGFTDLKLALVRDTGERSAARPDESAAGVDGDLGWAKRVFNANIQAISDTLSMLDQGDFARALDLVAGARHILIGGIGGSGIVAQALYQRCFRLGLRCDAPVDSQLQLMHASLLGPGDLAVAISYSGITNDPVLLLQEARAQGASTLCITGNRRSPLARLADVVLVSVSHELRSEPMAAQIAQLTLVDALYAALVARSPDTAQLNEERMVNAILPKSI
ncbi:MurR/RpiR family transcriptional regulator [Labrys sp. 22185]|uniref:MurR/RpiR family transcriptional regulator n=1 Tax=Labrys sp. 22185 TaxID=3453888 RepID=UPI003F87A71A